MKKQELMGQYDPNIEQNTEWCDVFPSHCFSDDCCDIGHRTLVAKIRNLAKSYNGINLFLCLPQRLGV